MFVSKDINKVAIWNNNASDLDNIAYQLYLDESLYKGINILTQSIFIYIYEKYPKDDIYYYRALKILRKNKLFKINEKG